MLLLAFAAGAACVGLAAVPTMNYAQAFAHPSRMEGNAGVIPDATISGAGFFRLACAAAALLIPLLAWLLVQTCPSEPRAARRLLADLRRDRFLLGVLLALGAFLRVTVASESLWYDEISAFLSFAIEGPGVAFGSYAVPTNHVPMTLATWLAWTLTGGSLHELTLRAPAILAGIATIPVGYALGAAVGGRRLARACAGVLAVAPIAVLESAEARGYPFVILGACVAALALARADRTRAAGDYALFVGASVFAAWSHPVAILLPIAAGVVGLFRDRRLVIACLLAGVCSSVLLSPLLGDLLASRADYVQSTSDQPTVFSREGLESLLGLALTWSTGGWAATAVLVGCWCVGVYTLMTQGSSRTKRAQRVLLPFTIAFLLALALALTLGTWIYARFLLFTVPSGALLLAFATLTRSRHRNSEWIALTLVVGASLLSLSQHPSKQPIRDAVAVVAAARAPDDRVATVGLPDNAVGFYTQQFGFEATPTGFLGKDLAMTLERERPRFVVMLYPERVETEVLRSLNAAYDRTLRLEGWADWGQGAVEVWERAR